MRTLSFGSTGPSVQLLQLALIRSGLAPLATDGIFGSATEQALRLFQSSRGLETDGIAGTQTQRRLLPWYTGYTVYRLRRGESFSTVAALFGVSTQAIETANPGSDPLRLPAGEAVIVPLPFSVVPTTIDYSSALVNYCVRGLSARYPFISVGEIGRSVMGRPIWRMTLGQGENRVLYNASHHANEWITTPLLLKFSEELAEAYVRGDSISGQSAAEMLTYATIGLVPAVNPDGIDLVTGELSSGSYFNGALKLAQAYPRFPFPSGWKANIAGIDLNLQYPAGWEQAKQNKKALGIISPAPADFPGSAPLSAPESRAMYDYTLTFSPDLILAYHTQGRVIYWRYLDYEPPMSKRIAETFSALSGYAVEETPYASGFAGYKDWYIKAYNRPGYTIEAGRGENPLPISDFPTIYRENLGILTYGSLVT